MAIVGFSGEMGAGKSTAAHLLGKISHKPVKIIKFAQPLYDMQDMIYDRIKGVYSKPADFTKDRVLLQLLGTDWGRNSLSASLWVDLWKSEAQNAINRGFYVACDDVRFDNEAEAIRSLGGEIVQVESAEASRRSKAGITGHASELGINGEKISAKVSNNETEGHFQLKLAHLACLAGFFK